MLENPAVRKLAANIKYEDTWTEEILGTTVQGWVWDTMQAAHILDNRTYISSLKFQTYVHFGVIDYDSHMKEFLTSDKKGEHGCNEFNRIDEAPIKDTLIYNGLDSLYELRLANLQRRLM